MSKQKLITKELAEKLPELYHNDQEGITLEDTEIYAKIFDPQGAYTLFVAEYDGKDTLWGYATFQDGMGEWGYASLSEIESARGRFGLPVERDIHFTPKKAKEISMIE